MHDANMTVAGFSILESKSLDPPLRKACHVLLAAGALVFALGLYVGFVKHGNSALVFSLLGVTTLVFAMIMFVMLKPDVFAFGGSHTATAQSAPPADTESAPAAEPSPEPAAVTAAVPESEPEALPQAEPEAPPQSAPKGKSPAESQAQPAAANTSEPENRAKTDLSILLNTTLGDVLLAALRNDPEGAGRLFARAITQADGLVPAAAAQQAKAPPSA